MSEWIVHIEGASEPALATHQLESFASALDEQLGTTGAATRLDVRSAVVAATFSVSALDAVGATELGVATFRAALASSGIVRVEPARVEVEQVGRADVVPA